MSTLNKHKTDYEVVDIRDELRGMFMAVDTQDNGFYWTIRAVMANGDKHLINHGFADSFQEITRQWNVEYYGKLPMLGIIDQGGHRTKEVSDWVSAMKHWWKYRGESRISTRQRLSRNDPLLILAKPSLYKSDLLYYIYTAVDRTMPGYWYIPADIDDDYCRQLIAISPDMTKRDGQEFENWTSHSKLDHYFDCEKMWLVLYEFAQEQLKENEWWRPDSRVKVKAKKQQVVRKPSVPMYDEYQ